MAKKTPKQKAAEEKRYIAACGAANAAELEPFLADPNQGIRATAAMNPDADAQILDRFADDKFWGVRIEVIRNANVSDATLRRLLEPRLPKDVFAAFIRAEAEAGRIALDGAFLRLPGHLPRL